MKALDLWRGRRPVSLMGTSEPTWPFEKDFEQMFQAMDRMLRPLRTRMLEENQEFFPACEIEETADAYFIEIDVPGMAREDIGIEMIGNTLKISGERKWEKEQGGEKGKHQYRSERSYGKFTRIFALPDEVRADEIEANYQSGVLSVTVPKAEPAHAKRIAIKEGKSPRKLTGKSSEAAKE